MEPDLAAWAAPLRPALLAWRSAFEHDDDATIVASGRALLVAIFEAGPGPVGLEDRVAELVLALARVVIAYRKPLLDGRRSSEAVLVAALRWLDVPDA